MATPYSLPVNMFLNMIEKDQEFFNYFSLTKQEASALAVSRSLDYLNEAVATILLKCSPDIDLDDMDDVNEQFNVDLKRKEIYLIASFMYEIYLSRDIAKLKTVNVNFTETELRVFDPSNARSTFMQMYESVKARNESLLDDYNNRDRGTGKYKESDYWVDFDSVDESE